MTALYPVPKGQGDSRHDERMKREMSALTPLCPPIEVGDRQLLLVAASVLDYCGDAFVNAANEGCVGGFGIDEVVNQSGGPELKAARKLLGGCPTGNAKSTPAFDHGNTKHIVHAVGPVYRVNRMKQGFDKDDKQAQAYMLSLDPLLRDAYRASMRCASTDCSATSLGMCLLSAGVFRGARPLDDVIEIGLRTVAHALAVSDACAAGLREVTICAFSEEEQLALSTAAQGLREEIAQGGDGSDHVLTRVILRPMAAPVPEPEPESRTEHNSFEGAYD